MDYSTFRPDHIEDVLVRMHDGQWFGWSNSKNKIYENLIILDNTKNKPTEKELTDTLAKQQSDFDALAYSRKREAEYHSIQECIHAILDDDLVALQEKRQAVKTKYPKS